MKTPEEIKKGLECCVTQYNCHIGDEQCCYHGGGECHYFIMCDALSYIQQLEVRLVEANKTLDDLRTKLAEYEKPLVPLTFEDVTEKSKNIYDNAIWLEQPDEEYGYDDTECIPALVSLFANYRMGIQYLHFLAWPKREIVFPVAEKGCYGKTWRCWSRRPTDEERKAAKWSD